MGEGVISYICSKEISFLEPVRPWMSFEGEYCSLVANELQFFDTVPWFPALELLQGDVQPEVDGNSVLV